jgi:predicted nuclease with TOPRIM domain
MTKKNHENNYGDKRAEGPRMIDELYERDMDTPVTNRTVFLVQLENRDQFRSIRKDAQELRSDMDRQFTEVRNDVTELRNDLTELRSDMDRQFTEVRNELTELRSDMDRQFTEVRSEISQLTSRVDTLESKVDQLITKSDITMKHVAFLTEKMVEYFDRQKS